MEKIESENLLHRAFSVFLFSSKYELLLQVSFIEQICWKNMEYMHILHVKQIAHIGNRTSILSLQLFRHST